MADGPDFEGFLRSKRIDSGAFRKVEPETWEEWKTDFEQMHPASFTVQKLNLINAVRRKYLLQLTVESKPAGAPTSGVAVGPRPGKPVIRPKTK